MMRANNADDYSAPVAAIDAQRPHEDDDPALASLSMREFQIFCRLAGGASVTAIAGQLNLSVKTVSTYRTRALEKLGFGTDAELRSYAVRRLTAGAVEDPVLSALVS